ncbi:MAG: glucose-1-phosphate adenylyltransferase [Anaerolineae bacterium]|nr:glucose-1-phosphate adenylyltransferase [Anaerolineae bacterium]
MPFQDVQAIVLGGGRGTRLYPLTKMRTKPAVPIGGRYRLIDISLSNCINSGITRAFILTQFLPASLHRHIHRTYRFDAFSDGSIEILPAEQTPTDSSWYQGTADAVRRQFERLLSRRPKDVLILSGDHLYRMDYGPFIQQHRETRADITIAALPVSTEEAPRYGILKADVERRVVAFEEKPQGTDLLSRLQSRPGDAQPYLASMGVYVFSIDALTSLLSGNPGDDFGKHIIPAAIELGRVHMYPFEGYWEDIGTISAFYEANLALTRPDPPFDFYDPDHPIYTRSRFLPSSRIDGCKIERTIVADGCRLYNADLVDCVIGLRSMIRPGVRLRQVVMMGADFYEGVAEKAENHLLERPHVGIGQDAQIERAIIDKNARIGQGVIVRSHAEDEDRDEEQYSIRDGIVVIPKNATVLDGAVI